MQDWRGGKNREGDGRQAGPSLTALVKLTLVSSDHSGCLNRLVLTNVQSCLFLGHASGFFRDIPISCFLGFLSQFLYGKLFLLQQLLTSPLWASSFTPHWLSLLGSCCLAHLGFLVTSRAPGSVPPETPGDTAQTPWVVSLKLFSLGLKRRESLSPSLHGGDWNPQHTKNSLQKAFSL